MKFKFYLPIMVLVLSLAMIGGGACRKKSPENYDYSHFSAIISVEKDGNFSSIGYAVVYAEKDNILQLQTAKHIVDNANNRYIITFKSGLSTDIVKINIPDKQADLAVIEVNRSLLQNGRDYKIPKFSTLNDYKSGANIYILRDEYDNCPERKIDSISNSNAIVSFLIRGKISTGRSGSPVFLKDTDVCLGVVSGYFNEKSGVGEKTMCLLYSISKQIKTESN